MQKHPMLTVKEAAVALGMDERSVREKLSLGQLKGEKKTVGQKDKWFIYKGEVDAALAKRGVTPPPDANATQFFGVEEDSHSGYDTVDAVSDDWLEVNREKVKVLAEEIVKPLVQKIEAQQEVIFEQKQAISDQDRQLRLLPDLQKQAEQRAQEVELKHVEIEALKKQIEAMEEQRQELEAKAGQAEEERKAAEIRALEVEALSKQITAMEDEKQQLAAQASEAAVLAGDLQALKTKVNELQKPWWKRFWQQGR